MQTVEHVASSLDLQRSLSDGNRRRFRLAGPSANLSLQREAEHRRLERELLVALRAEVAARAEEAPADPDGFVAWIEALRTSGPGQGDPLHPWLATTATREQIRWFVAQELAGEAGFGDVLAMTQVGMPPDVKLGMARNYWDEMGRGRRGGMHDPMLKPLAAALELRREGGFDALPEALAVGNLMVALAWNRDWVWHSVGCLGAVELTAPGRCVHVVDALTRIGLSPRTIRYYWVHATLDVRHSEEWNRDVFRAAVADDPRRARWIAEGALMRLTVGARSYAAYRRHLGVGG